MAKRKGRIRKSSTRAVGRTRSTRAKARTRTKRKPSAVLANALRAFKRALSSKRPDRVTKAAERYESALDASTKRARSKERAAALKREAKRVWNIRRGVNGLWTDKQRSRMPRDVRDAVARVWKPMPSGIDGRYLASDPSKRRDVVRVKGFTPVEGADGLEAAFGDARNIKGLVVEDPDGGPDTWIEFDDPLDDWVDLYEIERDYYESTGSVAGSYS